MKIIIETPTEETSEKVFLYFKRFCIENLKEFELIIEGTNFKHKQEKIVPATEERKVLDKQESLQ